MLQIIRIRRRISIVIGPILRHNIFIGYLSIDVPILGRLQLSGTVIIGFSIFILLGQAADCNRSTLVCIGSRHVDD